MTDAGNKTLANDGDVEAFIDAVPDARRRSEARTLVALMSRATGEPPVMWGDSIVGFGSYHYRYASGREGDAAAVGFSPRKGQMTVYIPMGFDALADDLAHLGPHRTSVSCLYLKRVEDVDLDVLERVVRTGYEAATTHVWPG